MRDFVPELVYHQDEPLSDWTAVPQHYVTRLARDTGTIVVQVGEGADEIFHGYQGYVDHRRVVVPFQRWVPAAIRAPGRRRRRARHRARWGGRCATARRSMTPATAGSRTGAARCASAGRSRSACCAAIIATPCGRSSSIWDEGGARRGDADLFQRMTYLELRQRLPELLLARMDRIAMASSVEGREPFLDHELVELAMALPPRMKHRDGNGKHVLREAMRDALPPESSLAPSRASAARWRSGCAATSVARPRRRCAARRWPSASSSTTTWSTACSPLTPPVGATGASTCGTSTASSGTTGGSRDSG